MNDLRKANEEPFVINNKVYLLGSPIVQTQTLEQLVHVLDQLGEGQPAVIINPEAQTVPNFNQLLSNLIQNNRTKQTFNVTSEDKYRFKDFTDEQLVEIVEDAVKHNPMLNYDVLLEMYQGLRIRAQSLFQLESLSRERDAIWASHCANPASNEGVERYSELQYKLIPEAQARYNEVCAKLQTLETGMTNNVTATSITNDKNTSITIHNTSEKPLQTKASVVANNDNTQKIQEVETNIIQTNNTDIDIKIWAPWLTADYLIMPLSVARNMVNSPNYEKLKEQQKDCIYDEESYKAVDPAYLIALGIPIYPDGNPVVYTKTGKFKRVGQQKVPINNLQYWYPEPRRLM